MNLRAKLLGTAIVFVCAAELAFACTASDAIDKARNSRTTDAYKSANDVAREVLDTEKINTDISRRVDVNDDTQTVTATTLDAATGALLIEKFGNSGSAVTNVSQYSKGDQFNKDTSLDTWRDMWRKMLDTESGPGKGAHAQGVSSFTIRQHMVWHAQDIVSEMKNNQMYPGGPQKTPTTSTAKAATPKAAPASSYSPMALG